MRLAHRPQALDRHSVKSHRPRTAARLGVIVVVPTPNPDPPSGHGKRARFEVNVGPHQAQHLGSPQSEQDDCEHTRQPVPLRGSR